MLVRNMWNYAYDAMHRILCIVAVKAVLYVTTYVMFSLVNHDQGGLTFNIIVN